MPSTADLNPFPQAQFSSRDRAEDHLDQLLFDGTDFTAAHGEGVGFLECTLEGAVLDDVQLAGSRWSECRWERVRGVHVSLVEASLVETVWEGCRLAAVSAWGSTWRDVTVRGGKIDFLNLRGARLKDVRFEDCVISELDLQEATVDGLSFEGCSLVLPEFGRGRYTRLDLSGATLRDPRGLAGLKGAVLGRAQVIDLAEALAAELGIIVTD